MFAKRNEQRKGFTLIELLVVIAIIALLVSILLPSLNTAKDLARGVACMNSVRNISFSTIMYTQDFEGFLFRSRHKNIKWHWHLLNEGYIDGYTPFICPSDQAINPQAVIDNNTIQLSIGANEAGPIPSYWYYNININTVEPGKVLFSDSSELSGAWRYVIGGIWDARYWPSDRHKDGSNVAFCDGHIENMQFDKLVPSDSVAAHALWYVPQTKDPNGGW